MYSTLSKVGESLPAVEVQEGDPGNKISIAQLFKGKKGVLFAVPGAFTPGCSKVDYIHTHVCAHTKHMKDTTVWCNGLMVWYSVTKDSVALLTWLHCTYCSKHQRLRS